jgi:hypothetical protein
MPVPRTKSQTQGIDWTFSFPLACEFVVTSLGPAVDAALDGSWDPCAGFAAPPAGAYIIADAYVAGCWEVGRRYRFAPVPCEGSKGKYIWCVAWELAVEHIANFQVRFRYLDM